MNQDSKVGLIVLGFVALGILFAKESAIDPTFILFFVIVICAIWFMRGKSEGN